MKNNIIKGLILVLALLTVTAQADESFSEWLAKQESAAQPKIEQTSGETSEAEVNGAGATEATAEWQLMLVNATHPIPDTWDPGELVEIKGGQKVARLILPALQEMFNAARKQGFDPYVNSGYRTSEKQKKLMQNKYEDYLEKGHSEEEARELAESWVAQPGTSEHEAGIGIDINSRSGDSKKVYNWLNEHAWEYGFIQRYPEDKTEITHIIHEPWHYRYVGKSVAKEMHEKNLCLEEYLGILD